MLGKGLFAAVLVATVISACGGPAVVQRPPADAGHDPIVVDSGPEEPIDAGSDVDAGPADVGTTEDAGEADAGFDAGTVEDAGSDPPDAGPPKICDPGVARCNSGQRVRCAADGTAEIADDSPVTETFQLPTSSRADVLIATTKRPIEGYDALAANVVDKLAARNVDYRIGVMVAHDDSRTPTLVSAPNQQRIVSPGPGAATAVAANLRAAVDQAESGNTGPLLERTKQALNSAVGTELLRAGARLSVLTLQRQGMDELSPGSVPSYAAFLDGFRPPDMAAFHGVGCGDTGRMLGLSLLTGGIFADCPSDPDATADAIAAWTAQPQQSFTLQDKPVTGSVAASVDGTAAPSTVEQKRVDLDEPPTGTTVVVTYQIDCSNP